MRPSRFRTALLAGLCPLAGCSAAAVDGAPTEAPRRPPAEGWAAADHAHVAPRVAEAGWFVDRTSEAGVDFEAPEPAEAPESLVDLTSGGGGVLADLTGDGLPDLLLTAPFGPNRLYVNDGDGRFSEREESGLEEWGHTYGAAAADLDDDGLREIFLFEREGVRVFANLGDGAFREEGHAYQAAEDEATVGGTLADLDADGRVDLLVCVQGTEVPDAELRGRPNRMLMGAGGYAFVDQTETLGMGSYLSGQTYASTLFDLNGDGRLEPYFVNDHGIRVRGNELYRNDDGGLFSEISQENGLDLAFNGMGVAAGDMDGDGEVELVMSDTQGRIRLVSVRDGYGLEVTQAWGAVPRDRDRFDVSWGTELADLDHDGNLDVLAAWGAKGLGEHDNGLTQGISIWLNKQPGSPLTDVSGPDPLPSTMWRTALVADIDGDGALDAVHSSMVGPVSVRAGRPPPEHHWLEVALVGPPGNRDGLGARVELRTAVGDQHRIVMAGGSGVHSSVEPVAHFGLGTQSEGVSGHVEWPDGSWSEVEIDGVDRRVVVVKPRD